MADQTKNSSGPELGSHAHAREVVKQTVDEIRAFWQSSPTEIKQFNDAFSKIKKELQDLEQDMEGWARTKGRQPDPKSTAEARCEKFATGVSQTMFGGTLALALVLMIVLGYLVHWVAHLLIPEPNMLAVLVAIVVVELVVGLTMFAQAAQLANHVKDRSEPIALAMAHNWRGVLGGLALVAMICIGMLVWIMMDGVAPFG